jgi:hypothetical protein
LFKNCWLVPEAQHIHKLFKQAKKSLPEEYSFGSPAFSISKAATFLGRFTGQALSRTYTDLLSKNRDVVKRQILTEA